MVTNETLSRWRTWQLATGAPPTTIALRVGHVRRIMRLAEADPWTITAEQLLEVLAAQPWKPNTRRSYRQSLRAFYAWAQATGERADSPAHLLPPVRVPRAVPRPTPEAIYRQAVLDADPRVRLMLHLAAVCGLRRGEIARVRREDVEPDLLGWSLRVKGKGGHVRSVPVPDDLARDLLAAPSGWLFPSTSRPGPMTPAHVGKLVARALPEGWTCHTLRHRCGTVAYAATRDLRAVQELLGHAKPETTAVYTELPDDALRACVRATAAA